MAQSTLPFHFGPYGLFLWLAKTSNKPISLTTWLAIDPFSFNFLLKQTYKSFLYLSETMDIFCWTGSVQQAQQSTYLAEGLIPLSLHETSRYHISLATNQSA